MLARAALLLTLLTTPSHATTPNADLLLCIAADASESVTAADYRLQRKGHALAIRQREVVEAITAGEHGRIGAVYFEWAKQDQQTVGVPWRVIDGAEAAVAFGDAVEAAPVPDWMSNPVRNTSISEAILFCLDQFARAPVRAERWVIDLSSDGTHNIGASLSEARAKALAQGATINALVIVNTDNPYPYATHENPEGGLPAYFEREVIGGPGAFLKVADGYSDFDTMMRKKFVLEVSGLAAQEGGHPTPPERALK